MSIRRRTSKKAKNGYVYEVYFTYNENGISRRYSKSGFSTKKEAQEHEAIKKAELNETGKLQKEINKTFKDVYNEFIEVGSSQYQPSTIYDTKRLYHYFEKELANLPIKSIDYAVLQKYFNSRADKGIVTNKNIKKAINRVLNYAIKLGYIKSNPSTLITVVGIERHRDNDNILEYKDFISIIKFLERTNKFKLKAYSIAIQIGYYTGLRISEVLALSKDDIDFDNHLIYVNKKLFYQGLRKEEFTVSNQMKSKASKSIIPLADNLEKSLKNWFNHNPYDKVVCDVDGYYISPITLSNDVKKISENIGISFHFHMLRHTFATNLVTSNVDLKTAQELMRHSNINTTISIYTHINDQHKRDIINEVFKIKCVENVSKIQNDGNTNTPPN